MFFDLHKAFDMVPHKNLLQKLQLIGVRGLALNWFRFYLIHEIEKYIEEKSYIESNKLIE